MGFQQGLSGLDAASSALSATGNNIANASTVGFKSADAQFADVYAASLAGAGATQIGIGTSVTTVATNYTQGNITTTNNPLDIAINGNGFFRMDNSGTVTWSRDGQFQVNNSGYVVNSQGAVLTGYLANTNGTIVQSTPADIQINTANLPPVATGAGPTASGLQMGLNLNSTMTTPSAETAPSVTGTNATFPVTITTGTNDELAVTLNGTAKTATIAGGTYASASALATAMQTAINAQYTTPGTGVTVTVNGSNQLVVTSDQAGTDSTLTIAAGAHNALASAFGAGGTTNVAGAYNFDPNNPLSYNSSTSATVYDSLGNAHTLALYFVKDGVTANQWSLYTTLDGSVATMAGPTTLSFSTSGALLSPTTGIVQQSFTISTGGTSALSFPLNLTGTTQYGSAFAVNSLTQDGYTSGMLSGLSVSSTGVIQGQYSNGQTRNLAQVVLGNFTDPNGLLALGGNQWQETATSGQPLINAPGSGSLGVLQSGAVEESNVDLTAQLVNLITEQRDYQANAQTIKAQDTVMQTLVNLQ